ncbi:bone marrow proteoglycan-like isoform X1 [Trachemys scripta elegans]|uniref:bone marrow proteoglycan-like isoform X1 n=1 Tax=Trachemys scripta elegans TaxID=31138 RepID=UPI001555CFB3|nr:bone marrow proteoglycan-like isoform X1 [Trachemys scripta elegans]
MKLFLVLALALLGAVSAHQLPSDEGAPEQEVPAEQGEEEPRELEPPCPTDSESFRVIVPGQGGCFARYVVVNNCQTFWNAQNVCARCYRGRLASIHGSVINRHLSCMARARTNRSQVWIGGITSGRNHCLHAHWVDRSSWNYSNWARGNPCRTGQMCVAMCPSGGQWRSVSCRVSMPFICQY